MKSLYFLLCFLCVLPLGACVSPAAKQAMTMQRRLDQLQAEHSSVPGFAMVTVHEGKLTTAATGQADPQGRAMSAATPVRIASITKTFVAAAVLRLWEQGKLMLDDAIAEYISPTHNRLLIADGYATETMTLRHLLMHAAGLDDHFIGDNFQKRVLANPSHQWTRTEQLDMLVQTTEPRSSPGEAFYYSDSGYLLLGELVERVSGLPLPQAIYTLNKFEQIGLQAARWEEDHATHSPPRAHQYLDGIDTFNIHGSVDAFGGGGLILSCNEVAAYFAALFNHKVFDRPETLELMTSAPGHPPDSPYRMGLFTGNIGGYTTYGHGGFWGTAVTVVPTFNLVVAGVALEKNATRAYRRTAKEFIELMITAEKK